MVVEITGTLDLDARARGWCKLPYPGHPKGCPNYDKSPECPPQVNWVQYVFDLSSPHWFVVERFDLGAHAARMLEAHPKWTDRQARNCLYWQNGVRKKLRAECHRLIQQRGMGNLYTLIPEAMGVNVFTTARKHGIGLERNPQETVYKIALLGKNYWSSQKEA